METRAHFRVFCLLIVACALALPIAANGEEGPAPGATTWLLPYLSDDVFAVELLDATRLGPFDKYRPQLEPLIPEARVLNLSGVQTLALVIADGEADPIIAILGKCPEETRDKIVPAFKNLLTRGAGEAAPEVASFVDGDTFCVGHAPLVKQLQGKPASQGKFATALSDAGNHLYLQLTMPSDRFLAKFEPQIEALMMFAPVRARWLGMLRDSATMLVSFDVQPKMDLQVQIVARKPDQQDKLLGDAKALIANLEQDQTRLADHPRFDAEFLLQLKRQFVLEWMQNGQLEKTDHGIAFHWTAAPEFSQQLLEDLPQRIAATDEAAVALRRESMLKQAGVGLLLYADRNREHLPDIVCAKTGKPLMSCAVRLLPVMEAFTTWDKLHLDEPWNSEHNAKVLSQVKRLFAANPKTPDGHADILAVTGHKEFGFLPNKPGEEPIAIEAITDGMSNTIMLVEVDPERSVPWAKPEDFTWDEAKPSAGLGSKDEPFFRVLFGDTRVVKVSRDESAETLKSLFGRNDGQSYQLKPVE